MKGRAKWRCSFSLKENEETWQLSAMCESALNPRPERNGDIKTLGGNWRHVNELWRSYDSIELTFTS